MAPPLSPRDGGRPRGANAMYGYSRSGSPWSGYMPMTQSETRELESMAEEETDDIASGATKEIMRAKLMHSISLLEVGCVGIEADSIYGAAILMPQVARTLGWPKAFTSRAVVAYIYLLVTIIIAGSLLTYLSKEEDVMDNFSGQPYLCDFGVGMDSREGGNGGLGPSGTTITAVRMYNFDQWNTRKFVKDSLTVLFPKLSNQIEQSVDPGEYGVESHLCRQICCLVFMLSIVTEMDRVLSMAKLLYYVPSENQDWLVLEDPSFDEDADKWLEHISVKVAGMSIVWKMIILFTIFVPKLMLFILTISSGTTFLMESAAIEDMIVNSTALGFLLNLDELIMSAIKTSAMEHLLEACQGYPLYDVKQDNKDKLVLFKEFQEQESQTGLLTMIWGLMPRQLIMVIFMTFLFIAQYYLTHCREHRDRWISQDMALPKALDFNFLNALLPFFFPLEEEETPWWTMPGG